MRSLAEQSAPVMTQVWHDHLPRACARGKVAGVCDEGGLAGLTGTLGGVTTEPDPRVTASKVVAGPDDLVGYHVVAMDSMIYEGDAIHVPRLLPGVPEFVAAAEAEASAEAFGSACSRR